MPAGWEYENGVPSGNGRRLSHAWLAGALVTLILLAPAARADELSDLRAENARLLAENRRLRDELATRQAANASPGGAADAGEPAGAGSKSFETAYVPRTRLTLEVDRDQATGSTTVSTPWYRTEDSSFLPRKEWIRFGARETAEGAFDGAWILLERQGGRASLEGVEQGRLVIDGRVVACPVEDYDVSRKRQPVGRAFETAHDERVRFAVPAEALALLSGATTARFEAGAVGFALADEHLAGAAAIAARVEPRVGTAPARPSS